MINNIKDLDQLLSVLRKKGVEKFSLNGLSLEINYNIQLQTPVKKQKNQQPIIAPGGITDETPVETPDALTEDQLLFYSVTTE